MVQCLSLGSLEGKLLNFEYEGANVKHAIYWGGKMY